MDLRFFLLYLTIRRRLSETECHSRTEWDILRERGAPTESNLSREGGNKKRKNQLTLRASWGHREKGLGGMMEAVARGNADQEKGGDSKSWWERRMWRMKKINRRNNWMQNSDERSNIWNTDFHQFCINYLHSNSYSSTQNGWLCLWQC